MTEAAGEPYANCQAPQLQCKGPHLSYCDGTRAVVCGTISDGVLSPWVYDCADAFGSHCIDHGNGSIECEGPAVGEKVCDDGIDGDGDGEVDCMDDDCSSSCIERVCDDGIDDDFDGKVDCDDSNCGGDPHCQ